MTKPFEWFKRAGQLWACDREDYGLEVYRRAKGFKADVFVWVACVDKFDMGVEFIDCEATDEAAKYAAENWAREYEKERES